MEIFNSTDNEKKKADYVSFVFNIMLNHSALTVIILMKP